MNSDLDLELDLAWASLSHRRHRGEVSTVWRLRRSFWRDCQTDCNTPPDWENQHFNMGGVNGGRLQGKAEKMRITRFIGEKCLSLWRSVMPMEGLQWRRRRKTSGTSSIYLLPVSITELWIRNMIKRGEGKTKTAGLDDNPPPKKKKTEPDEREDSQSKEAGHITIHL